MQKSIERERTFADPWLWIGCGAYAAIFGFLAFIRYSAHRNFVDLGLFAQVTSSAFGCFCSPLYGSQWAHHFSPILYVAGLFMQVYHSALTLAALQAIAGALFIPAVYGLVFERTDRRIARLCAIVAFLYPPLAGMVFGDFYENGFAPAAVAWLFWFFERESIAGILVLAAVTLAIKEDQAVFLAAAGTLAFLRYRPLPRGYAALAVAVVSVLVLGAYLLLIQPHANGGDPHWAGRFFSWNSGEATASVLPATINRAGFILLAFGPLLFLPFRTSAVVVAILPLAEVLGSSSSVTLTIGQHYAGAWIGYVFYAFVVAVARFYVTGPLRARRLLYWCIALCVLEFAVADPLHPGTMLARYSPRDAALDSFLSKLPPHFDVATQEEAYTHLAARDPNATLLPENGREAVTSCHILIDRAFPNSPRLQEYGDAVRSLVASRAYRTVSDDGAIALYRRADCP